MRKAGRGRIGVLRVRRAGRGLKRAGMRLRELGFNVKKGNVAALLPIGVFLVLYLGLGILFEYGMGISMGFYNIPIVVIFLVALLVACFQNRSLSFDDKLVVMGRGIGDKTIVTMILIFMAAGVFVGTVGRDSAESVAYLMLSVIPAEYSVAVLFVVSCFVSLSMGTSVGTITLITPIAVAVAAASGFSLPLCVPRSWRCHVRRQPVVHLRHHHCRLPGTRLPNERQVPGELQDRFAGGAGDAGDHSGAVAGHRHLRYGAKRLQPAGAHPVPHRSCGRHCGHQRVHRAFARHSVRLYHCGGRRRRGCYRSARQHGHRAPPACSRRLWWRCS